MTPKHKAMESYHSNHPAQHEITLLYFYIDLTILNAKVTTQEFYKSVDVKTTNGSTPICWVIWVLSRVPACS